MTNKGATSAHARAGASRRNQNNASIAVTTDRVISRRWHWTRMFIVIVATVFGSTIDAAELKYKELLASELVKDLPGILKTFDPKTGRFGSGIFCCTDQNVMYPLAVAYVTPVPDGPYYKSAELLDVIMKAGDALIDDADARGMWVFRKKDGSTWGDIYMPWTYSRWVRTFGLIRNDMPPERRGKWENALRLGYSGISKTCLGSVHNIPTHHAMGLYAAGKLLDRPDWCTQAADFMMKVVEHQAEAGYWSEGGGPVVAYNAVYVDALGTYYAMSKDQRVAPALKKASLFHRQFTYPSGQDVETVDQRNPFHHAISAGNVGFTFSPEGRAYLKTQWARYGMKKLSPDLIASLVLYGEEGPVADIKAAQDGQLWILTEGGVGRAAILRQGSWFVCLSAYTAPLSTSRWIQDRQNFVSIYHDHVGLIVGGGNTKLQPAWSNFTVGDTSLLKHTPGDTHPNFKPTGELYHLPSAVRLLNDREPGLELNYGKEKCRIQLKVIDDQTLQYEIAATTKSGLPVIAHVTLLPHIDKPIETGSGKRITLTAAPVVLNASELGGWIAHAGYRLQLPETASLHWPAKRHNPYRRDGSSTIGDARIEIRIPFDDDHARQRIVLEIVP